MHCIFLIFINNGDGGAFENTQQCKWLLKNSWKYGFIQRYPEGKEHITGIDYEPWHYRYVGRTHAEKMKGLGLCLEEYVVYLAGQGT